jgi:putative hydrolase of the HAD superfamily
MINGKGISAIIFDLDNCLCDAREVGEKLFEPVFDAVRKANQGTLALQTLELALAECWYTAFDAVAKRYGFDSKMFDAGRGAFAELEASGPMRPYPDISAIRQLPVRRYLVTSGFRRLQTSKIAVLGIEAWFDSVIIDAVDDPAHPGKQQIFESILAEECWRPNEVLVVGDNPGSELAAGRRLGMPTVQTVRPGVTYSDEADDHVTSLDELLVLLGY